MKKNRSRVFLTAGYETVSPGTGRKEFHPKKPRPGLEEYIREAGRGTLKQIGGGKNVNEGVIDNFMAARFNKQGNLAALIPSVDEDLQWKLCCRVEGACGSGGLALINGIKSVLAETAEVVLAIGVEVQNTVKAIYGADILAGAGWFKGDRKKGPRLFLSGVLQRPGGRLFRKVRPGENAAGLRPLVPERRRKRPPLRNRPGIPQYRGRPGNIGLDGTESPDVRRSPECL